MSEFSLLIDGKLVGGDATLDVINPATEELVGTCARASEAQLDAAVEAALAAQPAWAATPIAERRAVLNGVADIVEANAAELAELLTREEGKPLADSTMEVLGLAGFTRYFAAVELPVEILEESDTRRVEAHRVPLGVIGVISPWNGPLGTLAMRFGAALITGNAILVKPAAEAPLSMLRFGELIKDALPPGVVNIIADGNDLGPKISTHPLIRMVSFAGSVETGARVMSGAADTLKRISLELGGNDGALVLGDVDPKEVAPKLFDATFLNCGQTCIAIKRLFVHDSIYDAVCDELAAIARSKKVGDGLDEGTEIGPLQNRKQFERVKELIDEASRAGKVIAGGTAPNRPGYFIEPTIVRDIEEGVRLVDEEQFGPVLPVLRFSDVDAAIDRINRSHMGLGGSVWSSDVAEATRLAGRIEAGTVWVNSHMDLGPTIPFGGAKQSGIGAVLGRSGVEECTQLKVLNIAR